jgi:hypothetical protein
MPLEGDDHKNDPSGAAQQIAPNQGGESGSGLPPIVGPPNPPPTPSSENQRGKSDSKWRENTKLGLEIGGLLILLIYTLFSALQWAQIRWTNRLTREALNDNGQSLQATLGKMQGQIDAMNASVQQGSRLAKATEEANANVVDADRPWMGMGLDVSPLEVGKNPVAHMLIVNSGKRPAQVDIANLQADFFPNGFPKNPPYFFTPTTRSRNFIVPGSSLGLTMNLFQSNLIASDLDLLNSGKTVLYVYAKVDYRDIKDRSSHFTHGCWRYLPKTVVRDAGFVTCAEYNEAQ